MTRVKVLHNMPTPYALSSPDGLFALLEEGILVCDSFRDGVVEMTIRKVSAEELELCVFSFKGSYRCLHTDLKSYLDRCPPHTQTRVSIYRDRFTEGLSNILPMGFGSLWLDFSKCKKAKTAPIFGYTVTEVLDRDQIIRN